MGVYNERRLTFAEFIIALIQNISIKRHISRVFRKCSIEISEKIHNEGLILNILRRKIYLITISAEIKLITAYNPLNSSQKCKVPL